MSGKNRVEKVSEIDAHVSKQYNIVRRLGKGAYGIVWKAVEKKSKEIVAVKKIFEAFRNQTDAQRTFREIMFLLSFANHENIIRLIGLHKANNDRDIYLVFEYMETDLHIVIKKGNILMDIHKVFIMYQLFKAIKYIHSGNVIHRDLKPSNVLLNAQCHCKIADFGLARSVTQIGEGDGETGSDPTLTDYVATRWYRAPEILVASKRYTKGIDMWSLGCILGEMLLGEPLFPGSSTINQVEIIMATLPPPTREDLISVSAGYGTNLLEKTPNGPRRSLRDLLPEVSEKALDLISSLIVFNPTHRLTAVEALEHPYVADFHRRSNEPERGSSVIPLLRDDVQLSVDEYRNKLYAMMDGKHRKHEMMSRSRIKRLSEHIRKETAGRPAGNPVIGQGDGVLSKSVAHRRDDLRAIKKDGTSKPEATGTTPIPSRKTIRPSQIDSDERTAKTRTINLEYQQADPKNHHRPNTKSVATQYNYNLTNGNARNVSTPGPAKSCPYLNQQQQQLSKSQRSIQSDQAAAYGRSSQLAAAGRAKLRRGCRQSRVPSEIPYAKDTRHQDEAHQVSRLGHDRLVRTRMFPKTGADTTCCHYSTKNNTATGSAGGNNSPGSSSHASCHSAAQSQAVRNYLNQTIPSRRQPPKVDEQRYARGVPRNSLDNRAAPKTTESRTFYSSGNPNGPKGDPRNQQRSLQRFLDTDTGNEKKSGRRPSCLNSYNQSRGVIAASAYKDLRNGTIRW